MQLPPEITCAIWQHCFDSLSFNTLLTVSSCCHRFQQEVDYVLKDQALYKLHPTLITLNTLDMLLSKAKVIEVGYQQVLVNNNNAFLGEFRYIPKLSTWKLSDLSIHEMFHWCPVTQTMYWKQDTHTHKDVFVAVDGYTSDSFHPTEEKRVARYSSYNGDPNATTLYTTFSQQQNTVTVVEVNVDDGWLQFGILLDTNEGKLFLADVYHAFFPDCVLYVHRGHRGTVYSELHLKYFECTKVHKVTRKWTDELARRVSNIDQLKDWYIHHMSPQQAQQVETWMQEFST